MQIKSLAHKLPAPALRRETMDMFSLFQATRESHMCSFIILIGWLSFYTSIVFTVGNIGIAGRSPLILFTPIHLGAFPSILHSFNPL